MKKSSILLLVVLLTSFIAGNVMGATFTVTNLNDSGAGSLRAAISAANANAGPDIIIFSVAGTINVLSQLPDLGDPSGGTTIDGTTAPGFVMGGPPVVVLKGPGTGSFVRGVKITSANNEVRALQIGAFSWAIEISGAAASGNVIVGSYLGTDGAVAVDAANGVVIDGASNNRIGTDGDGVNDAAERNIISGNSGNGVRIIGSSATGNIVAGNFIGTDATGTVALGNLGQAGVQLISASNNRIGTDGNGMGDLAERNIISGNKGAGVSMSGSGNVVAGNFIGTDVTGTVALGNATFNDVFSSGIFLSGNNHRIGTDGNGVADEAERNVISGNNFRGITINGGNSTIIAGNYIGTNAMGTSPLGNVSLGVFVSSGIDNRIGTDGNGIADISERNIISGNTGGGILVQNSSTVGTIVAGNFIGTDATGTAALPNGQAGVAVGSGASNTLIGTDADGVADDAERNVISGNADAGVSASPNTVVAGNFIGTDVTGTVALGNRFGVGTTGARIGTNSDGINDAAERNVISGNTDLNFGIGVFVSGSGSIVAGNYIGTDVTGTAPLGNSLTGVRVNFASGNTVLSNTIAFNGGDGVFVLGNSSTQNKISQNSVFSNGGLGIDLSNSFPPNGVTPNDLGDGDTGANNLQNFPIITASSFDGLNTTIGGTINSNANINLAIEVFSNVTGHPSGFGEGGTFLGTTSSLTDGAGNGTWTLVIPGDVTNLVLTSTATDPAGNTSEFSASFQPVLAQPPVADAGPDQIVCAGLSVQIGGSPTGSGGNGGPYTFNWSPATGLDDATAANPNASPATTTTYTVNVTEPATGLSSIDQVNVTINPNPVADAGSDVSICAGQSVQIGGSPTGSGGSGIPTFAWSPAAGLSSTTDANPIANPPTTTTYSVTVTDANGCSATDQITVTVNPNPVAEAGADVTIGNGQSTVIGGAPTGSGGTGTLTFFWSPSSGLSSTTTPNPTATPAATTTYTVTVSDANGCTDTDDITVTVVQGPIADAGTDQTICAGQSVQIGGSPVGSGGTAPLSFSWSPTTGLDNPSIANPTASLTATMTFTVTVTDANNQTATDDVTVTVNPNPAADAGTDQTICAGASVQIGGSPTGSAGTGTLSFSWVPTVGLNDATAANPTATPTNTTAYTVMVTDANGCTATDQITVTVEDTEPPVIGTIIAPLGPQLVNTTINASAEFTDLCDVGGHRAEWDWGDGSTQDSEGIVDQSSNTVSGSHVYTVAGVYTLTLTLTDVEGSGLSDETVFQFLVVFDPEGGFVTGGGWINSPEGAFTANPSLTGKANFGFVAKYKKGKTTPDGRTEFQFKVANLNFHIASYEWLVVAGVQAKFKGNGTINQAGNYGFMLTAIDGQVNGGGGIDKFRIKIWDKDDGDVVVYDNKLGEADNSEAATELGGGSIVIHSNPESSSSLSSKLGTDSAMSLALEDAPAIPENYGLSQNSPNPFNPETEIRFELPEASYVILRIFNVRGQVIRTLVEAQYEPGYHSIGWDGKDKNGNAASSGIYLYQLRAGSFAQIRKMTLLK